MPVTSIIAQHKYIEKFTKSLVCNFCSGYASNGELCLHNLRYLIFRWTKPQLSILLVLEVRRILFNDVTINAAIMMMAS